jgi:hypothetical protein
MVCVFFVVVDFAVPDRFGDVSVVVVNGLDRNSKGLRGNSKGCYKSVNNKEVRAPHISQKADLLIDGNETLQQRALGSCIYNYFVSNRMRLE